jgi:hypothetical protein
MFAKNRARRNRFGQFSANDARREDAATDAGLTKQGAEGGISNILLEALKACGYAIGSAFGAVLAEKTGVLLDRGLRNKRPEKTAD